MQLTAQDKKAARDGFRYVVIRAGKRIAYTTTVEEGKRECGKAGRVVAISGMRYTAKNPFRGSLNVRNPSNGLVRNAGFVYRIYKGYRIKDIETGEMWTVTGHAPTIRGVQRYYVRDAKGDKFSMRRDDLVQGQKDGKLVVLDIENRGEPARNPSINVRNPSGAKQRARGVRSYGKGLFVEADLSGRHARMLDKAAGVRRKSAKLGPTYTKLMHREALAEAARVRNPKAKGWRLTPRANTVGTYMLAGEYNNLNEAADAWEICYATFPPARQNRDMRYKGYGPEWVFTAPNGQVFTVYDRSDVPRIGGVQGQYTSKDLLAWLKTQKKRNPSGAKRRNPIGFGAGGVGGLAGHQYPDVFRYIYEMRKRGLITREQEREATREASHKQRERDAWNVAFRVENEAKGKRRNPSAAEVGQAVGKYSKQAARGAGRAAKSAWEGTKSFFGSAYKSFKEHNPRKRRR